ncbi:DUF3887 domain-containing protein [Tissierella sp. MSJ-40]|uniref:DUF3887 domain-containing protein n=1 Tax=Tissierella simiarum TaxID=2841534 RepID=A0ABS6EAX3_9FIRM|nr:DUF3887 domain-containing protein [Tissierella simiarum]MBU5439328.1 DUF3887 domain-containing protein [Tissierella simiarum]
MKKTFVLLLSSLMIFSLSACQKAVEPSDAPDENVIIQNATEYFEQMCSGDFETIYNALPEGVKKQTKSAQTIQDSWDEAVTKAGGLPEDSEPEVSCYRPEHTEQIRVEFVIPCEKGDFKVFINYDSNGNLYNYVVWKNS